MCIALISTAHPKYALILIDNRDEYLGRPTAPADWWDPSNDHVLGGRDLHRDVHGTWLGVTRDGRVAVLTNFRDDAAPMEGARSRGAMVNAFLTQPADSASTTRDFVSDLISENGLQGVGGFSLICGRVGEPLAVVSNRTPSTEGAAWIATQPGQIFGLSNASFGDKTWPKVIEGEKLMSAAMARAVKEDFSEDQLINEMLELLSTDTLPRLSESEKKEGWESYLKYLRTSIFIPAIGGTAENTKADEIAAADTDQQIAVGTATSGVYGTQKQSVVLFGHDGQCIFFERSVFEPSPSRDRHFTFNYRF
ncbi:hypothetical protein MMC13_001404 [Lambiella insularis]|nr:hypothetical protein [Lambiella insularis]